MSKKIRILIADDHSMFREGLAGIISRIPDFEIVGEAKDGHEALSLSRELLPDVVLMDIQMPGMGGIEACREIRRELPGVRVVMLTVADDVPSIFDAVKAGAAGYVVKHSSFAELEKTIRAIFKEQGLRMEEVSPDTSGQTLREFQRLSRGAGKEQRLAAPLCPLTNREREILLLISQGKENKEIAAALKISENTVKNHISNVFQKLAVNDRTEAVVKSLKEGWI